MHKIVFLMMICCSLFAAAETETGELQYQLGAGDMLIIKVFGQDDLTLETRLPDSGTINYPFLGALQLRGMTIKEVETLIANGLKAGYLVSPNVYVGIVEYRPFYIHGEVRNPGAYPYQPAMTVNQAIALAGGLTERASRQKISISREASKQQNDSATLNSRVYAGDTVTIEPRFF